MRWFSTILYLLLWLIYFILSVIVFPYSKSFLIPIFLFIAVGAWSYGRSIGLLTTLVALICLYFITSVIHGNINTYYENRLSGPLLGITIVILVANLRTSYEALKTANINLDRRVEERNTELRNLTAKLLNGAESTRIHHGQILHDGIGQQLTGIQLFCTSLAEQLVEERNPNASIAHSMRTKAKTAHDIIRKTARMLFPVRMHETGLIPAINELISCFDEMEHISVMLEMNGDFLEIPDALALGLYRICHESVMCAATALNASAIHLGLNEDATGYQMTMQHNGESCSQLNENMEQRLILYRLQSIGGTVLIDHSANGFENIMYQIPKV